MFYFFLGGVRRDSSESNLVAVSPSGPEADVQITGIF